MTPALESGIGRTWSEVRGRYARSWQVPRGAEARGASARTGRARGGAHDQLRHQREVTRGAYGGVLALPVPAVAAVEGFALGGGLELALSCDLIVAGEDASVGLPEVSVGVIPGGGGTQLLTRRIGWPRAASVIFTARRLAAGEAAALGVVDEVVPAGAARDRALASFERRYLAATLARHAGNVTAAARASGVDRAHFYRLLHRHGFK